jgi:hypothetical protein
MPNLSELCASLPMAFVERQKHRAHKQRVALSRKLEWKEQKGKEHERVLAYRAREQRRTMHSSEVLTLQKSRKEVRRETLPPMRRETTADMFYAGKGVRQPKKAKNKASSEEMGTIRAHIVVKRFDASHMTCVYKGKRTK